MVILRSAHPFDIPLAEAYAHRASDGSDLIEYGFCGWATSPTEFRDVKTLSAWIPGSSPIDAAKKLMILRRDDTKFRLLFAERLFAPTLRAHELYTEGHIGSQMLCFIKVLSHRAMLSFPERSRDPLAWLDEPALNRIPAAIWLNGPVKEVRVARSDTEPSQALIVLLRHRQSPLLTTIEIVVSDDYTQAGRPAIFDKIELTGTDGFIRVHGIFEDNSQFPRLVVNRGSMEMIEREIPRDFGQVYRNAASGTADIKKLSRESYALAENFIETCRMIVSAIQNTY